MQTTLKSQVTKIVTQQTQTQVQPIEVLRGAKEFLKAPRSGAFKNSFGF